MSDLELERIKSEVDKELSPDPVQEAESYIEERENDRSLASDFSSSGVEGPEVPINEENQYSAIDQNIEGLNDKDLEILNMLLEELKKVPFEDPINPKQKETKKSHCDGKQSHPLPACRFTLRLQ